MPYQQPVDRRRDTRRLYEATGRKGWGEYLIVLVLVICAIIFAVMFYFSRRAMDAAGDLNNAIGGGTPLPSYLIETYPPEP